MFFVIKPSNPESMVHAMFLLSYYKVTFSSFSDGDHASSTFIKVSREYRKGDLRLAEMSFQMGFHQDNHFFTYTSHVYDKGIMLRKRDGTPIIITKTSRLCPVCRMNNKNRKKKRTFCGHLTFTEVI